MNSSTRSLHAGPHTPVALAGDVSRPGLHDRTTIGGGWSVVERMYETTHASKTSLLERQSGLLSDRLDRPVTLTDASSLKLMNAFNERGLQLGMTIGEGGFHSAHEINGRKTGQPVGVPEEPTRWIAVLPTKDPFSDAATALIHREHAHNVLLTMAAPDLLPEYGGLGKITVPSYPKSSKEFIHAQVWEKKDGTFNDVVTQGGLALDARLNGYRLTPVDVATSMIMLSRNYQKLHDRGMAYTDPKDANVAYGLNDAPVPVGADGLPIVRPAPAHTTPDELLFRVKKGSQQDLMDLADKRKTIFKDVVFIDSESMQRPGYATDPETPVNGAFTPNWIAKGVLEGQKRGDAAWKKAQADERNDVFHMAAIGYGMVTGKAPQDDLAAERWAKKAPALGELTPAQRDRARAYETINTRLEEDFSREGAVLKGHAREGLIPMELATGLHDGLEGRIPTIAAFKERMRVALRAATT